MITGWVSRWFRQRRYRTAMAKMNTFTCKNRRRAWQYGYDSYLTTGGMALSHRETTMNLQADELAGFLAAYSMYSLDADWG